MHALDHVCADVYKSVATLSLMSIRILAFPLVTELIKTNKTEAGPSSDRELLIQVAPRWLLLMKGKYTYEM